MPLVEHLRELRTRLVVCALALVPGIVVGFLAYQPITRFLTEPVCDLGDRALRPGACGPLVITGSLIKPFAIQTKVALATGLVASSPIWLYQLWAFVGPGLHRHERRRSLAFVAAALPLFGAGMALCYVLLPKGVEVLAGFTPPGVTLQVDYGDYLSLALRLFLVFGLAFLAPVLVVALNLAGALPAAQIRGWWRGIVLGVMVFAAVATPTGDPLTMLALALPVLSLLALAYVLCAVADRRRRAADPEPDYAALPDDEVSRL
jgi:sec-independent protein translocase protein TatC